MRIIKEEKNRMPVEALQASALEKIGRETKEGEENQELTCSKHQQFRGELGTHQTTDRA